MAAAKVDSFAMTSRLSLLRSRLMRLSRLRGLLRAAAAAATIGSSVVIAAFIVFAIDFCFRLDIFERLLVMFVAAAAVAWSLWRYALPLVRRRESLTETALFVERRQQIDSDLVAALQFETMSKTDFESPRLATAVIDYVSAATPSIRVFDGVVPRQLPRRALLCAICLVVAFIAFSAAPGHAAAFFQRILLRGAPYPTRTHFERIFVNRAQVFAATNSDTTVADSKAPQGQPLTFLVECTGQLPANGSVVLAPSSSKTARNQLSLARVAPSQRLTWLRDAAARLNDLLHSPPADISPRIRDELVTLIQCDAPQAIEPLVGAPLTTELQPALNQIERAIRDFDRRIEGSAVYQAELRHFNDDLRYEVLIGDAATQFADVQLIPLPIIQLDIVPRPPAYANAAVPKVNSAGSQVVVLEGSAVEAKVSCANKPLQSAWMTLQRGDVTERIELVASDDSNRTWFPPTDWLLAKNIVHELRYELQVVDADGLGLETPIRGAIRVQPDQPPTAMAKVVHKLILPSAVPVIGYQVSDDFGISRVVLTAEVERSVEKEPSAAPSSGPSGSTTDSATKQPPPEIETHRLVIVSGEKPLIGGEAPIQGTHPLSLAPLKLVKGDRLKLSVEAMDYRGEDESGQPRGQVATSEPVTLEVADEAAVLAAIAEADKRSEQQLSEIIERQLSSGGDRQ
jgi:hypothetical protein